MIKVLKQANFSGSLEAIEVKFKNKIYVLDEKTDKDCEACAFNMKSGKFDVCQMDADLGTACIRSENKRSNWKLKDVK